MGRREEKREATRMQILQAAASLIQERGFESATVDSIVEKADMSKGTFYYHFKSKDEVLMALGVLYMMETSQVIDKRLRNEEDPLEILRDILIKMAADTEVSREAARAYYMISMAEQFSETYQDHPLVLPNLISRLVSAARTKGQIQSELNDDELASLISGLTQTAHINWIAANESTPLTEKVDSWLYTLMKGISH